jgi:hypothetical protein
MKEEEALDHTLWRTRFQRGYGPVARQTTEWMHEFQKSASEKEAEVGFSIRADQLRERREGCQFRAQWKNYICTIQVTA